MKTIEEVKILLEKETGILFSANLAENKIHKEGAFDSWYNGFYNIVEFHTLYDQWNASIQNPWRMYIRPGQCPQILRF